MTRDGAEAARAAREHRALAGTGAGALAWGAGLEAVPIAQATSERLALTVAALIAVAVLAVLGGLLVLFFRREAESQAGPAPAGADVGRNGRGLWAPGAATGAVRAPDVLEDGDARGQEDEDRGPDADLHAGDAAEPGEDVHDGADEAGPEAEPAHAPAHAGPVVRPPLPREGWTAEITWAADATRFRVVARRDDDPEAAPVALAQTEPLPWPPRDDASVQALTDASVTLETVLLDSGWSSLPTGDAWYAKRFAWEPHPAGPDAPAGSGRFERPGAPAPGVAQDPGVRPH